ncbi:MAG: cytochrome c3 family protein [Thermoanaerobaculia bacterium]
MPRVPRGDATLSRSRSRSAIRYLVLALPLLASALAADDAVACLDCHDEIPGFENTVHGFLDCTDCHAGIDLDVHPDATPAPACADCHEDAVDEMATSVHADASSLGIEMDCQSCHGSIHALAPSTSPASPINPHRLAATCGRCHADPKLAEQLSYRRVLPLAAYEASVHAQALAAGEDGANCSSCHGSHGILKASDPESRVNPRNVGSTCGHCHGEIAETFAQSIHGQALAHGITDAPSCVDCHGEHRILSPAERGSPVFATNLPKQTCGRCHGSLRMAERFGLDARTVPAYEDSYHGLATRAGAVDAANCASCHGVHDILPSSDPRSHVNDANLAQTCGNCHPGAGTRFAIGPVHVLPDVKEHAAVTWVRRIYLWLIGLTIGAMLLHNGLDLYRKGRGPREATHAAVPARERMSIAFRWTHGALAVSFMVLVYTGFALKFPEALWARPLLQWEDSLGLRGLVHRIAAVVMLTAAAVHVVHLAVSRDARACIRRMWPGRADWSELVAKIRYLAGRDPHPPRSPWVGYGEKMEYLAVVWGTVIMAASGFVLWFENWALSWGPKWVTDLATVVHLYEAVLATLAILVWHFYAVIFDPLVYPMDPAWWTGRSAPGRSAEREDPGTPRERPSTRNEEPPG